MKSPKRFVLIVAAIVCFGTAQTALAGPDHKIETKKTIRRDGLDVAYYLLAYNTDWFEHYKCIVTWEVRRAHHGRWGKWERHSRTFWDGRGANNVQRILLGRQNAHEDVEWRNISCRRAR